MQAQRLPAARGVQWLTEGFMLYRRNPPLLTMLTLGFLMVVAAFSMIQPLGQFLLPLAVPALTALVANGCRILDRARNAGLVFDKGALTAGLSEHRLILLRLGVLHLGGMLIVLLLDLVVEQGGAWGFSVNPGADAHQLARFLRLLVVAGPLLLAFWFAPLLSAWDGVSAAKSVFFSLVAGLRNWRAFLAYGVAVTVLGVLLPSFVVIGASTISPHFGELVSLVIQAMLLLIFAPILMATVYLSYRDVFIHDAA